MAKQGVYGLASFKMQAAVEGGYPTSWDSAFSLKAIVKDSMSFNDQAPSENDIEVEDMDNYYASLPSSIATKGFTIQTYDMSKETYTYLMGYSELSGDEGWMAETPGFQLGNQAVQVVTKAINDFPAKTFEWANMSVKVSRTGTVGKSGFPNLQLEFKQASLSDSNGVEISGARWKIGAPSDY